MARGIKNKFVKTAPAGSDMELILLKMDELLVLYKALLVKLDVDTGVVATNFASTLGVIKKVSEELIPSPLKQGT